MSTTAKPEVRSVSIAEETWQKIELLAARQNLPAVDIFGRVLRAGLLVAEATLHSKNSVVIHGEHVIDFWWRESAE